MRRIDASSAAHRSASCSTSSAGTTTKRFVVVPADDVEQLADRCAALEASMRRIGLPLLRIESLNELTEVLGTFLSGRKSRIRTLPSVVDVGASDHVLVDGEYV